MLLSREGAPLRQGGQPVATSNWDRERAGVASGSPARDVGLATSHMSSTSTQSFRNFKHPDESFQDSMLVVRDRTLFHMGTIISRPQAFIPSGHSSLVLSTFYYSLSFLILPISVALAAVRHRRCRPSYYWLGRNWEGCVEVLEEVCLPSNIQDSDY